MKMERHKDIDGGYAWLILAAAFSVMFMAGMMVYSTGVINIALLDEIDADISRTSWVGATLLGAITLTGPVAGFLTKRLGCRISCFCGGILVFIGLVAAAFVSDVTSLIVTYGFVVGLGLGLAVNSALVVPGYYFRLKRGVACGVVASGAGFGMFAGGPLVRYLIEEYKLTGCFMIIGAIQANICVAACILRPSVALITRTREIENEDEMTDTKTSNSDHAECSLKSHAYGTDEDCDVHEQCFKGTNTKFTKCLDKSVIETDSLLTGEYCVQQEGENDSEVVKDVNSRSSTGARLKCFYNISCTGLPIQVLWKRATRVKINNKYGFLCFNISALFWNMGETACLFHLPNYAETKGSSKTQAASLFTVMGLASIFSRILAGFVGNDSSVGPLVIYTGLLGLEGTITLLFPLFSNSSTNQMVFSAVFGLYSGGPHSLTSLVTITLVGLENLPLALGVEYFCCGIGCLLGPPIASFIYTESNRYDYTFIFAGSLLLCASFFGLMTGFFWRRVQDSTSNRPIERSGGKISRTSSRTIM